MDSTWGIFYLQANKVGRERTRAYKILRLAGRLVGKQVGVPAYLPPSNWIIGSKYPITEQVYRHVGRFTTEQGRQVGWQVGWW